MKNPEKIDVFISYSERDTRELVPIVKELRARGCSVWWAEDGIEEGRWDHAIENALASSRRVLAFLTANADRADRGYIFDEVETARSEDKLIPVVIGNGGRSFALKGLTALLKRYSFADFGGVLSSEEFEKLASTLGFSKKAADTAEPPDAAQRLDLWFSKIEGMFGLDGSIRAYSFMLSCAFFEDGPFSEVQQISEALVQRLKTQEVGTNNELDPNYPRRTGQLLELLECELVDVEHTYTKLRQEVVRFEDRQRAAAALRFAWREFPDRRAVLENWLSDVVGSASSEGHMRVGLALGLLGQIDFLGTFREILSPWLLGSNDEQVRTADIALAVAAFEPAVATTISHTIKSWAASTDAKEKSTAIHLACGLTGARLSHSAIDILRIATSSNMDTLPTKLMDSLQRGLRAQLEVHSTDTDTSLFSLNKLVADISSWIADSLTNRSGSQRADPKSAIPLLMFLAVVGGLPIAPKSANSGGTSLQSLLRTHRSAAQVAAVINLALSQHKINGINSRDLSKGILRRWIEICRRGIDEKPKETISVARRETMLRLAALLQQTAANENDRDRVEYIFKSLFTPNEMFEARPDRTGSRGKER